MVIFGWLGIDLGHWDSGKAGVAVGSGRQLLVGAACSQWHVVVGGNQNSQFYFVLVYSMHQIQIKLKPTSWC